MNLPRLIVSDLDGTLLPECKVLPRHTRQVLGRLADMGVVIALASGKFFHLTWEYAQLLGPGTVAIALDGARFGYAPGNGSSNGIPREVALSILDAHDAPHLEMFADNGADEMLLRFRTPRVPESIQNWASRIHRVDDARPLLVGDPALVAFYGEHWAEMREIAQATESAHPTLRAAVFVASSYGTARVVIQQRDITKGSGVLELCRHFGFAPRECMVFGDWYNDLPLFSAGCTNVAMINAVPELQAQAHHLTERDNEAEGVAHFLAARFL
ncbi:MAG: HAD family hydrolase [SAR324 cluster bacterium]|nr:HAD family hydrolase [SAR324 cluster bacterium]